MRSRWSHLLLALLLVGQLSLLAAQTPDRGGERSLLAGMTLRLLGPLARGITALGDTVGDVRGAMAGRARLAEENRLLRSEVLELRRDRLRVGALEREAEALARGLGFERRTGIRTVLRAGPPRHELPKSVQLTAYRTAQEALTNIAKHARCDLVTIDLTDSGNVLTLEISDNGQGISTSEQGKPKAYGLKGLQERAKSVGGWLDVSTRAGHGTSIILSVPLDTGASGSKENPE